MAVPKVLGFTAKQLPKGSGWPWTWREGYAAPGHSWGG